METKPTQVKMQHATATIRVMTADDLPEVVALWRRTEGVGLNESDTPEQLTAYLARNPGQSFVALQTATQKIIGAVLCGDDGRRGYLHHLAVDSTQRKQGVGKALVQRCLDTLSRRNILKCNLFVFAANTEGQKFWSRIGWKGRGDLLMMQMTDFKPTKS